MIVIFIMMMTMMINGDNDWIVIDYDVNDDNEKK